MAGDASDGGMSRGRPCGGGPRRGGGRRSRTSPSAVGGRRGGGLLSPSAVGGLRGGGPRSSPSGGGLLPSPCWGGLSPDRGDGRPSSRNGGGLRSLSSPGEGVGRCINGTLGDFDGIWLGDWLARVGGGVLPLLRAARASAVARCGRPVVKLSSSAPLKPVKTGKSPWVYLW